MCMQQALQAAEFIAAVAELCPRCMHPSQGVDSSHHPRCPWRVAKSSFSFYSNQLICQCFYWKWLSSFLSKLILLLTSLVGFERSS